MEVQTTTLAHTEGKRVKSLISKLHINAHLFNRLFGGELYVQPTDDNERFMQHGVDVEHVDRDGPNGSARYAIDMWPAYDGTERGLWIPKHRIHFVTSVADLSIQAFDLDDVEQPLEVSPRMAAKKALRLLIDTTMDYLEIANQQREINALLQAETAPLQAAATTPGISNSTAAV